VANHGKSIIVEQTLYCHENQFPLTSRRVMNPPKKLERLLASETVNVFVGDMSSSGILREVPKLDY
jgi:hypothetical protein